MILKTDYRDFYDIWLSLDGKPPVWWRRTTDGPDRIEMFALLKAMGLSTPLINPKTGPCVVHRNIKAHCGEGKQLESGPAPQGNLAFNVEYVGDFPGESWRYLYLAGEVFWIKYSSTESWMSNVGDGNVEVLGRIPEVEIPNILRSPVWAVDFVRCLRRGLLAVDLNVAPGCWPVRHLVSGESIGRQVAGLLGR
jgi:hypothetical protein